MKITLDLDKGEVVPDNHIVSVIQKKLKSGVDFVIGSDIMLMALRVEVKEGRFRDDLEIEGIKGSLVAIEFEGADYYIRENGKMIEYPSDILLDNLLDKLIGI